MADLTIKQHDTWPPLRAQLSDADGPVDLTTVDTVRFLYKEATGITSVARVCTVTEALEGRVEYEWIAGDTALVKLYNAEFEVTWGDGEITTFPNSGYFTFEVVADLGP
jgi:hypothetical protein